MSVSPAVDVTLGAFYGDSQTKQAVLDFVFSGTPVVQEQNGGVLVTLDGAQTWVSTGEPVVPVHDATILLPEQMQISSVSVRYLDSGITIAEGLPLLAAPAAVTSDAVAEADWSQWTSTVGQSFGASAAAAFVNETVAGYQLGTLRLFPSAYNADTQSLTWYSHLAVTVTVTALDDDRSSPRASLEDRQRVAAMVDNPEALAQYAAAAATTASQAQYVVITSRALAASFEPLLQEKRSRGITAAVVTTDTIYANYAGTETGDNADKIRQYIADAYNHQGTRWVLLGGDSEVIPVRGVYGSVGYTVDNWLATDLYYACLDGTWNGDGDNLWGEANDGIGGGDIDLGAEVYVGRAPVSNLSEAANFVAKTVRYSTQSHANAATALWLGEQLDQQTQGSYSGIPIRQQTLSSSWSTVELYDTATSQWTAAQLLAQLNAGPNLVNHLGHSSESYNARLTTTDVAALRNVDPYFIYSQGCMAGSFDTVDVSVAEQHVVGTNGAFAAVMNSRYGWYIPGATPGGSHNFAMAFWTGAIQEGKNRLGEANQYARQTNRFRVGATGMDRWIYMETNLLGDPEAALQLAGDSDSGGEIRGQVWNDVNGDGARQAGEAGLAGQTVFLDSNNNGRLDRGTSTFSSSQPQSIPDPGTLRSTISVSGLAPISDVNLTLNVSHGYVGDLEAYLVSPSGTRVLLFSRVGGWGQNFRNTTLDDQAGSSIESASAPFTGSLRPQGRLSLLDGQDPNGVWTLEISDAMAWDSGVLESWSLGFVSDEAVTQTGADGNYSFSGLADGTYHVRVAPGTGWTATGPVAADVTLGGSSRQGLNFGVTDHSSPPITDLGAVDYRELTGVDLAGEAWFRIQTSHAGYLTLEAVADAAVSLQLYDSQRQALATGSQIASGQRVDRVVAADTVYFVRLAGSVQDARLRVANLLRLDGTSAVVEGTAGDDRFEFRAGAMHQLSINGISYQFSSGELSALRFDGLDGSDLASLCGGAGNDLVTYEPGKAVLSGPGYRAEVWGTEIITAQGGGGSDTALVTDSRGDDDFHARPGSAELLSPGYEGRFAGFQWIQAHASSGLDEAFLNDSSGDDVFFATPEYGSLTGDGYTLRATGFFAVHAYGTTGLDVAYLHDSAGNDTFFATPTYGRLYSDHFILRAKYFDAVHAYGVAGGDDVAYLNGSTSADTLVGTAAYTILFGDGFLNRAKYFEAVFAFGGGGNDQGSLHGSTGDEHLDAAANWARLAYAANVIQANDFASLRVSSSGGRDTRSLAQLSFLLELPDWA